MAFDRVRVLKIEKPSTGGTQTDIYPTDIDTNEDAIEARGIVFQNDTSEDETVLISRDASDNMTFADGQVSGIKTLAELLEGEDDDQVKDNVAVGDTFTVKDEYQHIIYDEFRVEGEYVVRGTSVLLGGDEAGGGLVDHALGGAYHTAATLAQLNALVSDATLDTSSASRTPSSHAASHVSGGGDAVKLDDLSAPDDNTDLNATTSQHGLLPKLGGGTTNFLRADGTWAAPPAGGTTVVFCGYDNTGGTAVAGTWVDVPLNAEIKKTTGFTHSNSTTPAEVTISATGTYRIDAQLTIDQTADADRSEALMRLMVDTGAGFVEIDGTRGAIYSRNTTEGKGTASVSIARDFTAGDKVKIQAIRNSGAGTLGLFADGSRMLIQKI